MSLRAQAIRVTVGATAASAMLVPVAAPAGAASPLDVARTALAALHMGGPFRPAGPGGGRVGGSTAFNSSNWSGWADSGSNTYKALAGTWTEPSITCVRSSDTEIAAFWVGIDGFTSSSVEQDGTIAICQNGAKSYYSWWEMYPTNSVQLVNAVKPGDKITSTVTLASGRYTLSVKDATTSSGSFSTTQTCGSGTTCANSSAEWIGERPSGSSGLFVLPKFTPWKVTSASVNGGSPGVISSYSDDQITMKNSGGKTLAKPSALSAGGTAFTDTWKASA